MAKKFPIFSDTKCVQCGQPIKYGETFVPVKEYAYHIPCASKILDVFSTAIYENNGSLFVGHKAVEQLRAADGCNAGKHLVLSGSNKCVNCGARVNRRR